MRYPSELLDEIRARLPVSRVVARRVKLKRLGREFVGLSPFKTERTPSFTVNDRKGFYHCFASGEHGDIFTFLIKTEGLTFYDAVEQLASEAGVALPAPAPADKEKTNRYERLREVLEEACGFFEAALRGREGSEARAYLEQRAVALSEIRSFRLGFAPDAKSALKAHLLARGYTLEEMQEAGLLIFGDDIPVPYDRFRGRLIFPIADAKQRVIAFGGRSLNPDRQPKYLNSPETVLFHKGHMLFNLAAAREVAREKKEVIVAEGYMDVIALTRAGFRNTVAPLGTALTVEQLRLLWTMAPMPLLCFDGDAAGRKAAHRALDIALPHLTPSHSLQFVFLPDGRDPDDMVKGGAADTLAKLIAAPISLIDVLFARERARHPLDTPEQRASFEERLMEFARRIEHRGLRYQYISLLRERLRVTAKLNGKPHKREWRTRSPGFFAQEPSRRQEARFGAAVDPRVAAALPRTESLLASKIVQAPAPTAAPREALLIAAVIRHPWLLDDHLEEVASMHFDDADCRRLRDQILTVHQVEEALDNKKLLEHLSLLGCDGELGRVERATAHNADPHFSPNADKAQVLEGWRHVLMVHGKAGLPRSLVEAESDYLSEPTDENFSKLRAVVQQIEIASS